MIIRALLLALAGLACPQAVPERAAPSVRGWRRDGSGVFPNAHPPTAWGEKKNVKWSARTGAGTSSPVVWGDRVILVAEPGTLVCLNRTDGKVVWNADIAGDLPAELKEKVREPKGTQDRARATPVTDGTWIFVSLTNGLVGCFSIDGKRRWVRFVEPARLGYGPSASPVLVGETLLVDSTRLTALDAATGRPRWTASEGETHYGTPALIQLGGEPFAVTPKGAVVRVSDGTVLAQGIASGLGGDQSPTPIVREDVVYFAYRHCSAVRLTLKDGKIGHEKLWEQDLPAEVISSPVLKDGLLFVIPSGEPEYCVLSEKTGEILLRKTVDLTPNFYPSLALAGDYLFLGNDKGETLVLRPGREYKEVGRSELPEGSGASASFEGPNIFLRSGEVLFCVGP